MIYLLHFDRPFKGVRHYMGKTSDWNTRIADHWAGRGSALLAAVNRAGIPYRRVRVWPGGRALERKLKARKNLSLLCPHCSGSVAWTRGRR